MTDPILVDPTASLWVSAHAGAGKTRVLIDRVTRLLIAGTAPEQILCLTFTKAAAAEMATRLSGKLGTLALADDETLRKLLAELHVAPDAVPLNVTRRLFARALETPGGLKIQTIHAFCERLLGRFPIEAGIAPGFEVLDDRTAAELLGLAQAQIIAATREYKTRDALATLSPLGETAMLQSVVRQLIDAKRNLAAQGLPVDLEACAANVSDALGLAQGETPEALRQNFLDGVPRAALREAVQVLARGNKTDQKYATLLTEIRFESYREIFLTAKDAPRQNICSAAISQAHPDIEALLRAEQTRVLVHVERSKLALAGARAEAALHLGMRIIARYEALKQQRGVLDYDDLIGKTVALFERSAAAWVLFKLDNGIDHILVDEAQDTNPLQWRVITALADEFFSGESARKATRSIFAVGDEKQSIYRFQGADPAIFARMEEHFDTKLQGIGANLHTPPLHRSWRSTKPVLDLVDAVFEQLPLDGGGGRLTHHLTREGQAGLVELWPTEKPSTVQKPEPWNVPLDYMNPASPRARLARKIADIIGGWLKESEPLPSQGRAIRPGDILILVRRRDVFVDEMIRALKHRLIPVAGSDRLALTAHIAVMDLMALARFVLLPEDDLTLATVLKSPFFGFSDDDLFALAHGRSGSLWRALPESHPARQRLIALIALSQRETPFGFFAQILGAGGGRAQLVARLGVDAEDPIEEFLRVAFEFERLHPPALQSFLSWLEAGQTEVKRDMDQGRDEVRVMTVHGAKGLESNIVILPDTCAMPHRMARAQMLPIDGVPIWSARKSEDPAPLAAARGFVDAAEEAEHLRLLYVALTRARDRLYICGYETNRAPDPLCWYALAEAAMTRIATQVTQPSGETVYRLETPQTAKPDGRAETTAAAVKADRLPGWIALPASPEPPARRTVSPSSLGGNLEPPVLSPRKPDNAPARFGRGRLIHRLLQTLPDLAGERRAATAARFLALPRHGLSPEEQAEIAQSVLAVLARTDFAPVFAPGSRAEVPVVGQLALRSGPVPIFGIVDRLAVTDEAVLIVDYKTNRPPPATADAVAPAYLSQMAAYAAVLGSIYPGRAIKTALLWTESLILMALPAEALAAALP